MLIFLKIHINMNLRPEIDSEVLFNLIQRLIKSPESNFSSLDDYLSKFSQNTASFREFYIKICVISKDISDFDLWNLVFQ